MPTNTQQVTIPIENATLNYIIQHETRRFIDNLDPSNPPTPTEIEIDLINKLKHKFKFLMLILIPRTVW